MRRLTLLALLIAAPAFAAAPPSGLLPIPQAAVFAGHVWALDRDPEGWVRVHAAPLSGRSKVLTRVTNGLSNVLPPRWHLAHGALWYAHVLDLRPRPSLTECRDAFGRLEAKELLRGRLVTAPGERPFDPEDPTDRENQFGDDFPAVSLRFWTRGSGGEYRLHYDFLAAGPSAVRHFMLTNARPRDEEAGEDAPWSFRVCHHKARYDRKSKGWVPEAKEVWVEEERIEVGFRGPFRVLAAGKDYYFLTDGGSLFRAPPAEKKGQSRRLFRIYDGRDRPVLATVGDADTGRTFLFVDSSKGPAFFEPAGEPKLVVYDPKDAADGVKKPFTTVLPLARMLVKRGLIKAK